ncbi:hypothetical protein [Aminobacter aminovorans]|uniref:Uncharacterized protein n=1 Tax=Aminobacter aminovorans TaxID=83263 RepID=A0AAC8YN41_AMIAI|nr:hypothetical protein [Aminobacter aminovorans]AMS40506.1 hypothetical protein AA2016_1574 [Aminobacter aminovorans]MBB3706562.1 hypothetical protein [Aminobacter aminovorans]
MAATATSCEMNLMALWLRHRSECRSVGQIVADARAGLLPGVHLKGRSFLIDDEKAALAAMSKGKG